MRKSLLVAVALMLFASSCGGGPETGPGPATPTSTTREEANVGEWKTWVVSSGSEVQVPPPPAPGSAQEKQE
ncbi:MAG: hypothetical protein ACRDIU_01980, partial [Actinomycetota bacterium]